MEHEIAQKTDFKKANSKAVLRQNKSVSEQSQPRVRPTSIYHLRIKSKTKVITDTTPQQFSMNFMIWNVHGVGARQKILKRICKEKRINFVALLER